MEERKISAGSYDLNKFLYGGYEKDIITTVYGDAGTGKTNLCLLASVSQAKKGKKVLFIDTEGGFSAERAKQLSGKENYEDILKNIILFKPVNFEEQKKAFSSLLKEIKRKGDIGLIVVDGMAMLYRLELGDAIKTGEDEKIKNINRELAEQMRTLAEIARTKEIPVIVTNQVYSEFLTREDIEKGKEKEFKMVGGSILQYWSKCILELVNNRGRRKLILRKHRSLKEKEISFEIINSGIRRRGWI